MIKFEKITPGSVLLDEHSERMGNTMMREIGIWKVHVKEVDTERRRVLASWNGNPATWWPEHHITRLRLKPSAAYMRQNPGSKEAGHLAPKAPE